jgi:octaheme c-type cytochrome (tetrathionate reductase family)
MSHPLPPTEPHETEIAARNRGQHWAALGLLGMTAAGAAALALALTPSRGASAAPDDPRAHLVRPPEPTDHHGFYKTALRDGPSVTQACLGCHPDAASEVMHSQHWTWLGNAAQVRGQGPAHASPVQIGKKNLINNYCLSIESNWPKCTSCHAGYGWKDATFDFSVPTHVDCLVCHDRSGTYRKGEAGLPPPDVDLRAAAESVGRPGRDNCGACHFAGGGGDAVKHGDLDGTLAHPSERMDVHMGRANLACVDCHRTDRHRIAGESMSVSTGAGLRIQCTDCHDRRPHQDERLNDHAGPLACAACHVPLLALETPTKMAWDWSTAGHDIPGAEPHEYLKAKGSFRYASQVVPEYYWYNGKAERYLKGDPVDAAQGVDINHPLGSIRDPGAQIWPFKVHRGKQPYDTRLGHLLVPQTYGAGGYWETFDWRVALEQGSKAAGIPFSGEYGFIRTRMFWPISHMVAPASHALTCTDCHSEHGRLDWTALGYDGDPAFRGGRSRLGLVPKERAP